MESPPAVNAIVSGATFGPGLARGGIFSLFGTRLADGERSAGTLPLPTDLNDLTVTVDGRPAPLFYVGDIQVNGQLPHGETGDVLVVVKSNRKSSTPYVLRIDEVAPRLFQTADDRCVAQNAPSYAINSPGNPARPGEVIIAYLSGIGAVSPLVPDGEASPSVPLARSGLPVSAKVGGKVADLHFLGLTPGLVGVAQANVEIVQGLPDGYQKLEISVGGESTACDIAVTNSEARSN